MAKRNSHREVTPTVIGNGDSKKIAKRSRSGVQMRLRNGKAWLAGGMLGLIAILLTVVGITVFATEEPPKYIIDGSDTPVVGVNDDEPEVGKYTTADIGFREADLYAGNGGFKKVPDLPNYYCMSTYSNENATSDGDVYFEEGEEDEILSKDNSGWMDYALNEPDGFVLDATQQTEGSLIYRDGLYKGQQIDAIITFSDMVLDDAEHDKGIQETAGVNNSDHSEEGKANLGDGYGCFPNLGDGDYTPGIVVNPNYRSRSDENKNDGRVYNFNFYSVHLKSFRVSIRYVKHGTNQVVDVDGHLTTTDLDRWQYMTARGAAKQLRVSRSFEETHDGSEVPGKTIIKNIVASGDGAWNDDYTQNPAHYSYGLVEVYYSTSEDEPDVVLDYGTSYPYADEAFYGVTQDVLTFVNPEDNGITKSVDKTSGCTVGDELTYTLSYPLLEWGSNLRSGMRYENINISDELQSDIRFVPGSLVVRKGGSTFSNYSSDVPSGTSGGTLKVDIDKNWLSSYDPDGDTLEVEFKAEIVSYPSDGIIRNHGTLETNFGDGPVDSNVVETTLTGAELSLVKSPDDQVISKENAKVGSEVTWDITVTNDSGVDVEDVTVEDKLLGTTVSPSDPVDLAAGESASYKATYKLTQDDIDAGKVVNTAIAHGTWNGGKQIDSNEDDATATIETDSHIKLTKIADPEKIAPEDAVPGTVIDYSFTLENDGQVSLSKVNIIDELDGLTDLVIDWDSSSDPETGDGELSVGETVNATASYAITQADIDAGKVTNVAKPEAYDNDGKPAPGEPAQVTTTIETLPGLDVKKVADKEVIEEEDAVPGTEINYTFTATNTGNVTIEDVAIDDQIEGIEPVIDWATSTDDATGDGVLAPGESVTATATYAITQADIEAGEVENHAIGTGKTPTGAPVESEPAVAVTEIDAHAELLLDKTTDTEQIDSDAVGTEITYGFTITNVGVVTVNDIAIEDYLEGVSDPIVDWDNSTDPDTGIGMLSPDEVVEATATYKVTQADVDAGEVKNTAIVHATLPNGDKLDSNRDNVTTEIAQTPHLSLEKVADSDVIDPAGEGDKINYTFTVTNDGDTTVSGVSIVDDLHGISDITYDWTNTVSGDGTLAPGESVTATAEYAVTQDDVDAGEVVNTATANGTTPTGTDVASEPAEARTELVPGQFGVASDVVRAVRETARDTFENSPLVQTGASAGIAVAAVAAVTGIVVAVIRLRRK